MPAQKSEWMVGSTEVLEGHHRSSKQMDTCGGYFAPSISKSQFSMSKNYITRRLERRGQSETFTDWDLNPPGWDSNPAKILLGTCTHMAGIQTQPKNPQYLASGSNEAQVLDVSSHKEFSERQSDG